MSDLTEAQKNFVMGVRDHVTYRTIGNRMRTAKVLEKLGLVSISNGYFAYLTEAGQKLKQDLSHED